MSPWKARPAWKWRTAHAPTCHYCGQRTARRAMTWDHIVPRAMGGPDEIWNAVSSCEPCNRVKADRVPSQHVLDCDHCQRALVRARVEGKVVA